MKYQFELVNLFCFTLPNFFTLQLNFSAMNQFWFSHWSLDYPWRDSNPRSLASETSALSTWPQGYFLPNSKVKTIIYILLYLSLKHSRQKYELNI